MPEKKVFDLKKIEEITEKNTDYIVDKNFAYIKIVHSLQNDILIKMGKKNEWLSKDEIYITGYRKEIGIDAPFATDYKVLFIKADSKYMDKLMNGHFILKPNQKIVLNRLYEEYKLKKINKESEISTLIIKSLFEQFFLLLLRDNIRVEKIKRISKQNEEVINFVIAYLNDSIGENIRFSDIVKKVGMSSTGLKMLFKEYTGMGVMQYYSTLKIERAKVMLLEGELNTTQIANILGYDSIHYFSRQFKNIVGISPTQYINQMTSNS